MSDIQNRKVAPNNVNRDLFNEKIPFKEVRVIDADGTQLGVMSKRDAQNIANKQNLDLLCVAPKAKPPVCKVLDYGRYHFEQQKKAKEAKRKQHVVEMKSLRLSPVVDTHDFENKGTSCTEMDRTGNEGQSRYAIPRPFDHASGSRAQNYE